MEYLVCEFRIEKRLVIGQHVKSIVHYINNKGFNNNILFKEIKEISGHIASYLPNYNAFRRSFDWIQTYNSIYWFKLTYFEIKGVIGAGGNTIKHL